MSRIVPWAIRSGRKRVQFELQGWQPIGGSGYQFTRIDVQTMHAPVGNCDNK